MRSETIAIHSGYDDDPTTKSVAVPIYQTVAYSFDSADHGAALFNLEAEGYQVEVVDNGEAALALLVPENPTPQSEAFDVVVLDVMLPGKDGFTVISELRQSGQFIPTLMLTARGHPDDVLRGFSAGADDYLTKPFDLGILIARLRGLLRRREWLQSSLSSAAVRIRIASLRCASASLYWPLALRATPMKGWVAAMSDRRY